MVTFFFSGAWACTAGASSAAPSSAAPTAWMNRFMVSLLLVSASEPPADLGRQGNVLTQLLRLEREVPGDQVHVEAAEDAALVDLLLGEEGVRDRGLGAHHARADVRRHDGEFLRHQQVERGGGDLEVARARGLRGRGAHPDGGV